MYIILILCATGVVLKEKGTVVTGVTYHTVGHFSSLYYWNLDKKVSQDDPIHRCLQWTKLSNAVRMITILTCHCYSFYFVDTSESVNTSLL